MSNLLLEMYRLNQTVETLQAKVTGLELDNTKLRNDLGDIREIIRGTVNEGITGKREY